MFKLVSMGVIKKPALGPNPLSVKKAKNSKKIRKDKPKRKRSGKRSKALSALKKQ